jgi:hypothetical protein
MQVARLGDQGEQAIQLDIVLEKAFGSAKEIGETSSSVTANSISKCGFHISAKPLLRTCQGTTGSAPRHIQTWENLVSKSKPIPRTAREKQAICRSLVRSPILLDQKYVNTLAPQLTLLRESSFDRTSYGCPSI